MLGEHCGLVLEFPGVVGSIVETASDPWLSTVVPERPDVNLAPTLTALARTPVSVFTCGARQADEATAAGFTEVVARQVAMGLDLPVEGEAPADVEDRVDLAGVGAVNDRAYGSARHELERTLGALPAGELHAYGRRGDDGALLSVGLVFDCDDDASVQYVATLPSARRAGHAEAVMRRALADAAARGLRTTTLTASEEGRPLYERLGYRVVGEVELRRRPRI
jgi:ribosomal protein S18 acetylase RimI-like enzyme